MQRNFSNPNFVTERENVYLENSKIPWTSSVLKSAFRLFDWNAMFSTDQDMHDALSFLNTYGLLVIDNVPCEKGQVLKLGKELGAIRVTNYGLTFDVEAKPNPNNLAYTALELGLHVDLPYYIDMPDIQGLHCIRSAGAGAGGENKFVDVYQVAEEIKRTHPEHYHLLSTVPLEYVDDMKHDDGKRYRLAGRHPVFNLDHKGNFVYGAWNNQVRSWFFPGSPDDIQHIYDAMFTFREYYSKPENVFEVRLKPGQFVIFDNLRVMHARSAYQVSSETDRFLEGAYYTWDSVRSKIRCLRETLGIGSDKPFV